MLSPFRHVSPFLLICALASSPLPAQQGDRPNETQGAVPTHLSIPPAPALSPEEALKTLQVASGYRVEIAAADPLIGAPVAMTFGPDGRLWVVEMHGFMRNADGRGEDAKIGVIATLEDTDGDGRFDKRTEFLGGLVLPRAIALVGDGVLVGEPPHLWFARDTDGDGRADEKKEIASDYGTPENPEHTANGLLRAMDNWIYSANHTVRYRYLGSGKFKSEPTVSRGQWGITQDDIGRLYHNNNSDPLRRDSVPAEYFARNPGLTDFSGVNVQLAPRDLRLYPARVTPGVNRGYQSLDESGRITEVTAACGPLLYRGDALPELTGNAFVCEPSANLVKRIVLTPEGDLLRGHNAYEGGEFLASTDERFRPVNLASGPDGALYVVDMYRGIIQHRIYLTTYLRKQIDARGLADGLGMGRIYRLTPAQGLKAPRPFDLAKDSAEALVAHLKSANSWWRETAQRLLVERRDPAAIPALRILSMDTAAAPVARVHALWTLEGMEALDRSTVLGALQDPSNEVKTTALRLGEHWLAAGDDDFLTRALQVVDLDDPKAPHAVVQQLVLSLGAVPGEKAFPPLLRLVQRHGYRPFIADAAVSGLAGRSAEFITLAFTQAVPHGLTPVVVRAANGIWRSENTTQTARLDALFGDPASPTWGLDCLVDSLRTLVVARDDGRPPSARVAAKPEKLLELARRPSPFRGKAIAVVPYLRWPGHEDDASTRATPLDPEQQRLFEKGRTVFATICAGCHQPNGEGLKGMAPSLVTSRYVTGDERILGRIVLQGKFSENLVMPSLQTLDDEALAGVLTFLRRSWGHAADPVAPATLARLREETKARAESWTDEELARLQEALRSSH